MKEKILYAAWAAMYVLCVGLGTIEGAAGFGKAVLVFIAICFFVPGFWLLWESMVRQDRKGILRIRIISGLSLGLTTITFCLNILAVQWPEAVGDAMFELLNLASAPMLCCQYWFLSIFLWACLLVASFKKPD